MNGGIHPDMKTSNYLNNLYHFLSLKFVQAGAAYSIRDFKFQSASTNTRKYPPTTTSSALSKHTNEQRVPQGGEVEVYIADTGGRFLLREIGMPALSGNKPLPCWLIQTRDRILLQSRTKYSGSDSTKQLAHYK